METKTPANEEAGTIDTRSARNRVRIAWMERIGLLLAG
jgi:hypothetical protein